MFENDFIDGIVYNYNKVENSTCDRLPEAWPHGVLGLQANLVKESCISFNILLISIISKALFNVVVRC